MTVKVSVIGTILSLILSTIVYFFYRLYNVRRFYKGLPQPPHSFLWGHLKVMGEVTAQFPPNTHPQALYTAIARKYNLNGIFYIDLWPIAPSFVVLSDPNLLEQVTVRKPMPMAPLVSDFLAPMFGDGIIAAVNGPVWKTLHNAMAPAFSWSHIRSVTGLVIDESVHFREALDNFANTREVFSMENTVMKLIFDVISQLIFNFPLYAQTKGSQELEDLREMIELAEGDMDIATKFNLPLQFKRFFRRRTILGRLNPMITNQIQERFDLLIRDKIVPSRKNPNSILDMMLREKVRDEEGNGRGDKSGALTPRERDLFRNNIKGLLVGGHGTTADSLCFTYMLLSKAPDAVATLIAEHDQKLGASHAETIKTLLESPEKLQELPYTEAVIKEVLRLFPVGFGIRSAPPGSQLQHDAQDLPIDNGLAIALNGHDLHYNPKYFASPTQFRPERWLDPANEVPRSYFRTFSRGTRACLGQNLAMNTMKIVLIMTIRDYEFHCAGLKPNNKPRHVYTDLDTTYGDIIFQEVGLEAKPRGGMMMTVKKRQRV